MGKEMIGVIVSSGFGAGWSTWNEPELALDQELVNLIENNPYSDWLAYCEDKYPEAYLGGLEDCSVEWLPKGTRFRIDEYDGSESLHVESDSSWQIAL